MKQDVFVFLRLEERNAMDLKIAKCAAIKFMEQVMQMPAHFFIEAREKLRDLLLCHRWSQVDIPDRQAGKCLRIAREQTVQEGGPTPQVSQNKKRLFNRLCFVSRKKNIIQKETEPMDELPQGPDCIKK